MYEYWYLLDDIQKSLASIIHFTADMTEVKKKR